MKTIVCSISTARRVARIYWHSVSTYLVLVSMLAKYAQIYDLLSLQDSYSDNVVCQEMSACVCVSNIFVRSLVRLRVYIHVCKCVYELCQ